jgi:small subunit ribosomal protein S13e
VSRVGTSPSLSCEFGAVAAFCTSWLLLLQHPLWQQLRQRPRSHDGPVSHSTLLFPSFLHNSMGRMHAPGKGISKRSLPYKRSPPSWLKISASDVEEHVCKLAKKGLTPSQIGVILRDSNGIAQVKHVTGQKVVRILKANGLAPEIPEDLYMLIKKAVQVRKHLEKNRKDKDSKFRLILIESRIHRLARYYRTTRKLPANWRYESDTASTMVA